MTDIFRKRIRKSLADLNLQSALDGNAEIRIKVRKAAFEALADPQTLREQAHRVRSDVIDHLPEYLDQFITHAQENGMLVHQAANADQAIKLVLEIALKHGAKLIAKSKTMVSEEIKLNHALEGYGLDVVETDLGEYIVQLRGELPSHIITPAIHLRRQDVGMLFQEKLGLPYTEDISKMTSVARKTLRKVFLDTDIGISGVNFGVAETGTLCVVTNEGNGRMVTTVPRVHIALMGIERLVPSIRDLALMLSVLPRSATGQKLSVYTSLLNKPRSRDDPDGPNERHIILVDNGRREVRSSGLREILYCIRCGACLNTCPVFREIGGHAYVSLSGKGSPYPGPLGSVISPALFGQHEYGHLARASSLCGACREVCPVDIDLPKLLLRVRAGITANQTQPTVKHNAPKALAMGLKLYTMAATSPRRFATSQRMAGLFGSLATIFSKGEPWIRLPGFSGWGFSKDFPRPAARSFRSKYARYLISSKAVQDQSVLPPMVKAKAIHAAHNIPIQRYKGIDEFASELETIGGNYISCSPAEVTGHVLEILRSHGMDELLVWDDQYLLPGMIDQLSSSGIHITHPTGESINTSSTVRAGLTGASAGIAESGSLLILSGPGRPLTTSLLPEIHIALLWDKDIYEELTQVLQREDIKQAPAAVLITGPSRTADIEMTLTIGVHGPGELLVICLRSG